MNQHENAAVVVELVEQLGRRNSWCGATHLQKTAYFLRELTSVPLDFDFVLYKHGPFSFDLQSEISYLVANDLLDLRPNQPPYGPSLEKGGRAHLLMERFEDVADRYEQQITFVAERLASKGVVQLEKLGTALWVTANTEAETPRDRANEIVKLKSHIEYEDALEAVREFDQMKAEWTALNA